MGIVQIVVVILILVLLVKPVGTYLYHVFSNEPNRTDRVFGTAEKGIYRLIGLKQRGGMSWKKYALSFIVTNLVLVVFSYLFLRLQMGFRSTRAGLAIWKRRLPSTR